MKIDYGDDRALVGFAKIVDKHFVRLDGLFDKKSSS